MRVLVTGASGFFGSGITKRLRAAGHQVTGASRSSGEAEDEMVLDITSRESCTRTFSAVGPIDVVVHAAALAHTDREIANSLCLRVNVDGTRNVIEAAAEAGVHHFVYISSVMVYGDYDLPTDVREDTPCHPSDVYARSKLLGEAECFSRAGGMRLSVLRMATMYDNGWLLNVRKRVRPISGGGVIYLLVDSARRRYSLCSLANGAEVVTRAAEGTVPPGVYNVADDYHYSQDEILAAVQTEDGAGRVVRVPAAVLKATGKLIEAFARWRSDAIALRGMYWKFFENNLYSVEKLRCAGFAGAPDLLRLGRGAN